MAFHVQRKIRFQHCDPAAIVFFPRYFEMINAVVEDWFAEELGADFYELHMTRRTGVPTVNINTDFTAPSQLGDLLDFYLEPVHLGGASLELTVNAYCDDELRLRSQSTLVHVDMNTGKPVAWPDELRHRITKDINKGDPV